MTVMNKIFTLKRQSTTSLERILFIGFLAIFTLSFYFKPINYYQADLRGIKIPDLSPMHYFGIYGPTCGLIRSFVNLAHGRLLDGFYANFTGPVLFLFFLLAFVYLSYRFFGGKKRLSLKLSPKESRIMAIAIISVFLISWLIRMATPLKSVT